MTGRVRNKHRIGKIEQEKMGMLSIVGFEWPKGTRPVEEVRGVRQVFRWGGGSGRG